jgi:hypothetical protein
MLNPCTEGRVKGLRGCEDDEMSAKDFLEKETLVLNKIISLVEQQKGQTPISLTYLLENTTLQEEEVKQIVSLLEKEGDITITHPAQRVSLIQPLSAGYKKISAWEEKNAAQKPKKRLLSVGKIIGGSLLAALLGLFLWWLGLSPSTTDIVPLSASVPIRLYQKDFFPPNVNLPAEFYYFPNAPEDGEPIVTKNTEETMELIEQLNISYIPVTLDGAVTIRFDVENIAPSYQVNINSLQVAVNHTPINNPENIFLTPPELGGGVFQKFELALNDDAQLRQENGVVYYEAKLTLNGENVDYIYLRPEERETIEISIQLDQPGIFELVPIIEYAYRDKTAKVEASGYTVVYPDEYRVWLSRIDICQDEGCDNGGRILEPSHVVSSTQRTEFFPKIIGDVDQAVSCFFEPKWIVFESSSATLGVFNRLYIIDTNGENFKVIDPTNIYVNEIRYLAWTDSGTLVYENTYYDHTIAKEITEYFIVDPDTLVIEEIEDVDQLKIIHDNSSRIENFNHWEPSLSVGGEWLIDRSEDSNKGFSITRTDSSCSQDISIAPLLSSTNWILQP